MVAPWEWGGSSNDERGRFYFRGDRARWAVAEFWRRPSKLLLRAQATPSGASVARLRWGRAARMAAAAPVLNEDERMAVRRDEIVRELLVTEKNYVDRYGARACRTPRLSNGPPQSERVLLGVCAQNWRDEDYQHPRFRTAVLEP